MEDGVCCGNLWAIIVRAYGKFKLKARIGLSCRVERSLLWEITGSLAAAGNDLRVGKELLFSKPKIAVK